MIAFARSVEELVCEAFEPIAMSAGGSYGVAQQLLVTLEGLAVGARRAADRHAIARLTDVVFIAVPDQLKLDAHASALARRRARIRQIAARSAA